MLSFFLSLCFMIVLARATLAHRQCQCPVLLKFRTNLDQHRGKSSWTLSLLNGCNRGGWSTKQWTLLRRKVGVARNSTEIRIGARREMETKWTYQKVVKMSLLNMFILLPWPGLEYLFIRSQLCSTIVLCNAALEDVDRHWTLNLAVK